MAEPSWRSVSGPEEGGIFDGDQPAQVTKFGPLVA
jgi:hypothetical protein